MTLARLIGGFKSPLYTKRGSGETALQMCIRDRFITMQPMMAIRIRYHPLVLFYKYIISVAVRLGQARAANFGRLYEIMAISCKPADDIPIRRAAFEAIMKLSKWQIRRKGSVAMKLAIGIDTGGTCTDAILYDFETGKVLGQNKALTTYDDLTRGILESLDGLDPALCRKATVAGLSTPLATNALSLIHI